MGTSGCVSFMFTREGVIIIDKEDVDEEKLMEDALKRVPPIFSQTAMFSKFAQSLTIWVQYAMILRPRVINT